MMALTDIDDASHSLTLTFHLRPVRLYRCGKVNEEEEVQKEGDLENIGTTFGGRASLFFGRSVTARENRTTILHKVRAIHLKYWGSVAFACVANGDWVNCRGRHERHARKTVIPPSCVGIAESIWVP